MSREAVLLQWERKIEAEERKIEADERKVEAGEPKVGADERRAGGRFIRSADHRQHSDPEDHARAERPHAEADANAVSDAAATSDATADADAHALTETAEPARLRPVEDATHPEPRRFERRPATLAQPAADRRTITITGNPTPARRRRPVMDAQLAQPDRIALWAFLLGLFLVAVAAGTAHA